MANPLIGKRRFASRSDREREKLQAQISTYAVRFHADAEAAERRALVARLEAQPPTRMSEGLDTFIAQMMSLVDRHVAVMILVLIFCGRGFSQTAAQLEAQYTLCEKHHIPSDKCTDAIYQELKATEDKPLDPQVAVALAVVKARRSTLSNPDSMQLNTVFLTTDGNWCLDIAATNAFGGMTASHAVLSDKGKWFLSPPITDPWLGHCEKAKVNIFKYSSGVGAGDMKPGTDYTEQVKAALREGK